MTVDPIITNKMLSDAIKAMRPDDHFDFHKIILEVAHENQPAYVRALYAEVEKGGNDDPFQTLHISLGGRIRQLCEAANYTYSQHRSPDIFGHVNECADYRKGG